MIFSITKSALAPSLISKLPCNSFCFSLNREHILPKSTFPQFRKHPVNIVPFPVRHNNARGNLRYSDEHCGGHMITACDNCMVGGGWCPGMAIRNSEGLRPSPVWMPLVGASVLMLSDQYPSDKDRIHREVLDLSVAEAWACSRSLTDEEIRHIHQL